VILAFVVSRADQAPKLRTTPSAQHASSGQSVWRIYRSDLSDSALAARLIISPSFLLKLGVSNEAMSRPYIHSRADFSEVSPGRFL
jgi:hypothetical protein